MRWKHPEKGIVAPGYFIPVMESNGLITELDMKVWEQVCQTLQDWIKSGHKVIPISVNVSSVEGDHRCGRGTAKCRLYCSDG